MNDVDCAVIGAGVVGLAIARACAQRGLSTVLLEQHSSYGTETSSRNSSVIHSGVYYDKSSLKSRACIHGRDMLYEFCRQHGVEHRQCGKLIVATNAAEEARLDQLYTNARNVEIVDAHLLSTAEIRSREPALLVKSALWIPAAGIVDSHALMTALLGEFEHASGIFATRSEVTRIHRETTGFTITLSNEPTSLRTRAVINAAGLHATALAMRIEGIDPTSVPRMHLAKGNYFEYAGRSPFRHLIYPVPVDGGLGVHVTLDMAGRMRFGPDVEWVDNIDYGVAAERAATFYPAIRRYWPDLPDNSLRPAFAGIRPKLCGPGEPAADFSIQDVTTHQVPGLICLYGIESPGLTASLALAEEVAQILE
ncbi:MAG: NAD(P)/FAD-dependent oxidoreductase [Steroidobacteraceae bacterium]